MPYYPNAYLMLICTFSFPYIHFYHYIFSTHPVPSYDSIILDLGDRSHSNRRRLNRTVALRCSLNSLPHQLETASWNPNTVSQHQHTGQQRHRSSLVHGSKRRWDHIDKRADTQCDLEEHQVHHTHHPLPPRPRHSSGDLLVEAGISEEADNSSECGHGEDSVVELDGRWVLKHIPPPDVRSVLFAGVKLLEKLSLWWCEAVAHHWEFVVDHSCIQTSDKSARHCGCENEEGETGDGFAEDAQVWVGTGGKVCEAGGWVREECSVSENRESGPEHSSVNAERSSEVGSKSVLRDSWVRAWRKEIILQPRLDHPPSNKPLESDAGRDTQQGERHWLGDSAAGDEVDCREDEGETDEAAPLAVEPFHVVDFLEFGEVHVGVEEFELW